MPSRPQVSVILPVYNRSSLVGEAVGSILGGSFADFELIAVDDGSTDDSPAVLAGLAAADARIRVITQTNAGAYAARNAGAAAATAPLLAMADADDVSLPDRLESQVQIMSQQPSLLLLGGGMTMTNAAGEAIRTVSVPESHDDLVAALRTHNPVHTTTVMIRAEAFSAADGFRRAFRVGGDYDLWLRLSERGRIGNINRPLARYRVHGDQISTRGLGDQVRSMLACQAAARQRGQTGHDPLASAIAITPGLLSEMGVTPEQVNRSEIGSCVWWATLLCDAGNPTVAVSLLDRASELSAVTSVSGATRAAIHRGYARAYGMLNRRISQMASAARARLMEARLSPRQIARRLAGKVSGGSAPGRGKTGNKPLTQ